MLRCTDHIEQHVFACTHVQMSLLREVEVFVRYAVNFRAQHAICGGWCLPI